MGEGSREEGRRCAMEGDRRRKGVGSRESVGGRKGGDAAGVGEIEGDVKAAGIEVISKTWNTYLSITSICLYSATLSLYVS